MTHMYREKEIRMKADFCLETIQARGQWCTIYKVLKMKNCHSRILYPAKISFKNEIEMQIFFLGIQKLKDFGTRRLALEKCRKSPSGRRKDIKWKSRST